jgi:hypothetical protein
MQSVFGFEGKAFIMSQLKQREYLETVTGLNWQQLDLTRVEQAVGQVLNARPESYQCGPNNGMGSPFPYEKPSHLPYLEQAYWENQRRWYIAPVLPASLVKDIPTEKPVEEAPRFKPACPASIYDMPPQQTEQELC